MLDKSIPYYDVIMKREKGNVVKNYTIPSGYQVVFYSEGDEDEWAEIETSVAEFDTEDEAREYFIKRYIPYTSELKRRCIFIENENNKKVATLTVWWNDKEPKSEPWLHWVAVNPEFQGLGLGKALVSQGMKLLIDIVGDVDAYLHTQTWSYKAISIYEKVGFKIIDDQDIGGYKNDKCKKAKEIIAKYSRSYSKE